MVNISYEPTEDSSEQSILIATSDDAMYKFDEVVVTVPLGCLKRSKPTFIPPLPDQLVQAIRHVGYGRLEKVYVRFDTAFWQKEEPDGVKPFEFRFLTPEYATEQNPEKWSMECVCLSALGDGYASATLIFYLHGPIGEHVTSLVRGYEQDSLEQYNRLDGFFSPYYTRLPGYNDKTCRPIGFYNTDWQNDSLAGNGSYSTFQVSDHKKDGLVELDKCLAILAHGWPERRLWFAGEHTSPTEALGTTTGAYWSGEVVAERMARVYGLESRQ